MLYMYDPNKKTFRDIRHFTGLINRPATSNKIKSSGCYLFGYEDDAQCTIFGNKLVIMNMCYSCPDVHICFQ